MCRPDVEGRPESAPRRRMSCFWRSFVRLSCLRNQTTPRRETVEDVLVERLLAVPRYGMGFRTGQREL